MAKAMSETTQGPVDTERLFSAIAFLLMILSLTCMYSTRLSSLKSFLAMTRVAGCTFGTTLSKVFPRELVIVREVMDTAKPYFQPHRITATGFDY